ncbi:Binding-like protein [Theobroma cacao]|uniref:Binding-like protein n=1 Tax=Theobroma cacao TaxID=3641 RepID=A0A061G182_THECC|nr:Binding-like protein [Theobroma cacao]
MSNMIAASDVAQFNQSSVDQAIFNAAQWGITEFIVEIIKPNLDLLMIYDQHLRNIFQIAIAHRQEKVFSLIYGLDTIKYLFLPFRDRMGNNMLHLAGKLSPESQLKLQKISGAALQMQRELQWFKLKKVDVKVEEDEKASLPDSYEVFVESLICGMDTMTLEQAQATLMSREARKKSKEGDRDPSDLALVTGVCRRKSTGDDCDVLTILENMNANSDWYLDSAFTTHICYQKDCFDLLQERVVGNLTLGNKSIVKVMGLRVVKVKMFDGVVCSSGGVAYVPKMRDMVLMRGNLHNGLYHLKCEASKGWEQCTGDGSYQSEISFAEEVVEGSHGVDDGERTKNLSICRWSHGFPYGRLPQPVASLLTWVGSSFQRRQIWWRDGRAPSPVGELLIAASVKSALPFSVDKIWWRNGLVPSHAGELLLAASLKSALPNRQQIWWRDGLVPSHADELLLAASLKLALPNRRQTLSRNRIILLQVPPLPMLQCPLSFIPDSRVLEGARSIALSLGTRGQVPLSCQTRIFRVWQVREVPGRELESIVPPRFDQNNKGETPYEAFDRSHAELVKEGEKWMKDIAQSSTVVGTLIITIMFAALFTVPGGPDQDTGVPLLLKNKPFKVFIISDAISLFASTTSVLIFVGILTSRYTADDFLKSLPNKLIIGLSSLFISIATMMVAFSSTVIIMVKGQLEIVIPIVLLAGIPIGLFVWLQFPLLVKIFISTYGPGIFDRKMKWV